MQIEHTGELQHTALPQSTELCCTLPLSQLNLNECRVLGSCSMPIATPTRSAECIYLCLSRLCLRARSGERGKGIGIALWPTESRRVRGLILSIGLVCQTGNSNSIFVAATPQLPPYCCPHFPSPHSIPICKSVGILFVWPVNLFAPKVANAN
ncbi:hypothetical protein ACLKA6_011165 [Drosophila palustris]